MNDNTGKYLKPAKRCSTPAVVFGIAVDSETCSSPVTGQYQEKVFRSVAACVSKKRGGKWSLPKTIETSDCNALRQWIHSNADCKRRNYVIAPIASDVLTLTGWWDYGKSKGIALARDSKSDTYSDASIKTVGSITVRRCILRGTPDIFDYTEMGRRYIWLSGNQYVAASEQHIGESIGFSPAINLFRELGAELSRYTILDRAILWSQVLMHLSNWWAENSTAPFGLTLGGLAMGILRSNTKPKTLATHNDEYIHKLERLACIGGRASVWYVGTVGNAPTIPVHWKSHRGQSNNPRMVGTVRLIDIRSMYPYLLREHDYPTRYAGRVGNVPASELQSLASHYGVIARVTLYSDSGEYAYRTANRITYPRGYFQTVLTGPEIQSLGPKDKIVKVHDGGLYYLDRPFSNAAAKLLQMRVDARNAKKGVWELFAKAVGNNLGGKLAQRRTILKPRPDLAPKHEWGEWIESIPEKETATRFRAVQGMVFEHVKDDGGYGPYTASFAYLTAYGRLHMANIRKQCPPDTVLSQDTDGIWVLGDNAYNQLRDTFAFGNDPGALSLKDQTSSCVFLSPRHYYTDNGWTLAGFSSRNLNIERMEIIDTYTVNPTNLGVSAAPTKLISRTRVSKLVLDHVGGEISPDGWVRPPYLTPPKEYQL